MGNNNESIEDLCRIFVEKGKQNPNWIINNMVAFLMEYKDRYGRREISGSTIRNMSK
jgi:DNA-binding XRE family transcriptional regulator